MTTTGGSRSD